MKKLLVFLVFTGILFEMSAQDKKLKPYLNIWALVQTDVIFDIKQMDPDWIGGFRPSKIPVKPGDPGWGTYGHIYFSLRPSTFKFEGVLPLNHKWGPIRLRFEFDLFGMGVHAGEQTIRFRLAYGKWGPFLIGKDWSTFIDLEAYPNTFEWWGPSGMALLPSSTLRFTQKLSSKSQMELALELPGSNIDAGQLRQIDPALLNVRTKDILPDFIARFTNRGKWGYVKAAFLLRDLTYEVISDSLNKAITHSRFGWALNLTSNIYLFDKHGIIRPQIVGGQGYAGYNNDGGVEIAPDETGHAVVPFQWGFAAFYDHYFNDRWMTSLGYSQTCQFNSEGQLDDAFNHSQYVVVQLMYQILKDHLKVGINYQYGKKFVKDGASADDQRILFTVQYQINWVHD